MDNAMTTRARIVRIGNSQGVRIAKPILEQSGISDEVDVEVKDQSIILRAIRAARAGWEDAFQKMAERGDDMLFDTQSSVSEWDEKDWTWK